MINTLPKSLIESVGRVIDLDTSKFPSADISHHKTKKHFVFEHVVDWANKTQDPYDELPSFDMHNRITNIGSHVYDTKDPHDELSQEHAKHLENHHYYSVDAYITGGLEEDHETGSSHVNEHLLKAHKAKRQPKKEFKFGEDEDYQKVLNIDHLDEALSKNKLDKQLTTYSGLGFNPGKLVKEDGMLHLPAYTSSSTNRAVALLYAKPNEEDGIHHVLQIKHPKGSTGLYVGDNEDFSPFRHKEHIAPRGITLKVNPDPEVHMDNMGNTVHVWHATRHLKYEKDKK